MKYGFLCGPGYNGYVGPQDLLFPSLSLFSVPHCFLQSSFVPWQTVLIKPLMLTLGNHTGLANSKCFDSKRESLLCKRSN